MHELALEARALTKRFGNFVALDRLDLRVEPGESVALLGAASAGKSVAIRCLAGLARPTGGSVTLGGEALGSRQGMAARRRVGVLGQEPAFHQWMTGREVLALAADLLGVSTHAAPEAVSHTLELAGPGDVADQGVGTYSLPQLQRLGMAQALVGAPALLLLDEPLGWLDPVGRSEMLELLRTLRGSVSLIVATKDVALAESTCRRVVVLDAGRAIADGPTREVLDRAAPREYVLETSPSPGLAFAGLAARLDREPWVHDVTAEDSTLRIAVDDQRRAERELLPAVVATGIAVRALRRERPPVDALVEHLREDGT